jgi:hypothetical protein
MAAAAIESIAAADSIAATSDSSEKSESSEDDDSADETYDIDEEDNTESQDTEGAETVAAREEEIITEGAAQLGTGPSSRLRKRRGHRGSARAKKTKKQQPAPVPGQTEGFVQRKLPAYQGASALEAADDPGCALVSLNFMMESEGFEPFTTAEVLSAHKSALEAQLTNQTASNKEEWNANTASNYIGNPDDGGAMSQAHVYHLFRQRFGNGNFTFKRCDKQDLTVAPGEGEPHKYYLVTGVLERALSQKGGVPLLYGTRAEQRNTTFQNLKFMHAICVVPGDFFICKNKRSSLDNGKPSYERLNIDYLKLQADGNPKRGGYMRYIYRAFKVQLFQPKPASRPASEIDTEAQENGKRARTE